MRRRCHGRSASDREIVPSLRSVPEAVVLNVQFLEAEWSERRGIERPARVKVCNDEQDVIDDEADGHRVTLSNPLRQEARGPVGAPPGPVAV